MSNRWWLRLGAALCAAALSACGGGGGGGGGGDDVRVRVDRSRVAVLGMNGHGIASDQIGFTLESGSGTYFAAALSDSDAVSLQVAFTSATTASVNVDIGQVPAGSRTSGQLTFVLCRDEACRQEVWRQQIPYTATMYTLDTRPLAITGYEGVASPAVTLGVAPADTSGELVFDTTSAAFLTADHRAAGEVVLTASAAGLRSGSYSGTVRVQQRHDGVLHETAQTIAVSFTVGNGIVAPAIAALPMTAFTTSQDLRGQAPVAFAGAQRPAWTATSDSPWLVLDGASGQGPGSIGFHVDVPTAASLTNWQDHTAQVTIASPGMSDVQVPVVLSKRLPDVGMVTPSGAIAGQAQEVRVTGRGFTGLTAADFSLGGTPPPAVTIESDHAARLSVPALPAGPRRVSVTTAIGERGASAVLGVRDAGAIGTAVVASAGQKRALLFDASRNALFATTWRSNKLVRYRLNAGVWEASARDVASIGKLALAPDGDTLYVASGSRLLAIDPDTLQTRQTFAAPFALDGGFNYGDPLAQTHDLRIWFAGSQWDGLVAFNRALGAFEPGIAGTAPDLTIYSAQLQAPADGSTLLIQSNGISPEPPMVWYSAANAGLQTRADAPGGGSQNVVFSGDGALMLASGASPGLYRTADFELLGQVQLDPDLVPWVTLLSPDGRRIFAVVASSGSVVMDHVEVFDATATESGTSQFVKLGDIPLPDKAVGCDLMQTSDCDARGRWLLDPTGSVLFWIGDAKLVVLPIAPSLSGIDATGAVRARLRLKPALTGPVRR